MKKYPVSKHSVCWLILLLTIFGTSLRAQSPHVGGDVYITTTDGTIRAELTISRLPRTKAYSLWLNSGFTVQSIRDSIGTRFYSSQKYYKPDQTFENFQYFLPASDGKTRFLPTSLTVSYMGAFPVYTDSTPKAERGDWKGNIAFNNQILRAAEQTGWYPVLYDTLQDRSYQEVTYDLTIHAPGAKSIYLNGSPPQPGPVAHFKSDTPYPLLLFVGNYDYRAHNKTNLLNTSISEAQAGVIDDWFGRMKDYYAKNLGIPYGQDITLLNAKPISLRNEWMFVTYPTIATITHKDGLAGLVNGKTNAIADSNYLTIYAHELAHYYFGTLLNPNSTLRWMFLEGVAEYLSLQASRELLGQPLYDQKLERYAGDSWGMKKDFVPLKEITLPSQIGETYRYRYIPVLLTELERKVGREQLWKWLRLVLSKQNPTTDYAFLKNTLLESGMNKDTLAVFEKDYLTSQAGLKKLVSEFNSKNPYSYAWGMAKEIKKESDTQKPHLFYTSVQKIPNDLDSLDLAGDRFRAWVKSNCDPANTNCTSDFNTYETLEQARQRLAVWIKNKGEGCIVEEVTY